MLHDTRARSESGFVPVPYGRLYYEVAGDGPTVLFVHGFTLDTRMWDDQWPVFAERYRVVRLDLRGFGRSEAEPLPYSNMDDLVAVLDHLAVSRAHIVGLSMGATVVVDFALAHPERVHALVAVDGGPSGTGAPPPEVQHVIAQAGAGQVSEALEAWLATALFAPAMEQPEVAARMREMVTDYTWWSARNPGLGQPLRPPAVGRLAEIGAPTLVVVGERELPTIRVHCETLAADIPGARLVNLPGVGHMSNMEDPRAFNTAVLEFLAATP
jgi:pimeloyl-ACP methyl ester carboxylesterase